jgi:hypothetical protein
MTKRKNNLKAALDRDGMQGKDDARFFEYVRFVKWVT